MNLNAALTAYGLAKHNLAPRTRLEYASKLDAWAAWLATHTCPLHPEPATQIEQVNATHVNEYLGTLTAMPSPGLNRNHRPIGANTLHGYARVLKAFLRWAVLEDLLPDRVPRRIQMPRKEQHVVAVLTPNDIKRLLAACARPHGDLYPWMAERDRTIIMLLLDTGMRASELCGLRLCDVHIDKHDAYVKVMGKGRKEREIGLGVRSRQQLHRWITRYRPEPRPNAACDAVFLTRERTALDRKGLGALFHRLKEATGITHARVSPHDFRHTFAWQYLVQGGDVMKLSRLLGHSDLVVTSGYLAAFTSRDARQDAISPLDRLGDSPTLVKRSS